MAEIDELEKRSKEVLNKLGYSVFTIKDKAIIAHALREMHERAINGLTEEDCIKRLEQIGWVNGYLSGHGDRELVTKNINGIIFEVGDAEKSSVLIPKSSTYPKPWQEEIF